MNKFSYINGIKKNLEMEKQFSHIDGKLFVSNGWIDSHIHVYSKSKYKIDRNLKEAFEGVIIVFDAGSTGYANITDAINESSTWFVDLYFWLNVSPGGLTTINELNHPVVDEEKYRNAIDMKKVIGTKIRLSDQAIGDDTESYLNLINLAATTNKPIMYHIGNRPPTFADIAPLIRKQDVVTHFYHNKNEDIIEYSESVDNNIPFKKGVGWGQASMSVERLEKMMERKLLPDFSSTDMHEAVFKNKSVRLNNLISLLLHYGATLEEAIKTVTENPFELIKSVYENYDDTYTVFKIVNEENKIKDSTGETVIIDKQIVPVGTWVKGVFNEI